MTAITNEKNLSGLSVLNPNPSKLAGPELLHNLVSTYGQDECPALDFLSKQGDILSFSYTQFHAAADALASRIATTLRASSSNKSQARLIIPVLIPQSPQLYIALLAILKVGGAFCPLNLDAPEERVKFILKDVEASLVLVSSELASKIPKGNGDYETLLVEGGDGQSDRSPSLEYDYRIPQPEDLAYVMYTSGSTGTPKGVAISHSAATQCLLAHDRHIPQFKRFLQFAAPTFDVSVFEIFFPLFRRGTLVCCDRIEMLSDLPRVLRTMNVDACELTPSVAGSLLRKKTNAPGLKLLLTIGEMLNDPVVREFGGDSMTDSMLWGMYGPTEATIHCTLQPAFAKASSRTNIGFPLDNVSAYIIDIASGSENVTVSPIGEVGELAVGGSQLAEGYINRPEQTSRAFVNTLWGPMYRTGDKARMNGDGLIECLGRIDETQVKLNGQRIELGEVEQAILRTEDCHSAFASVISNVLVAFVAVEGASGMEDRIRSVCKSWLPAFMVPADIVTMPSFPQLPSGKIDRKGLVAQYQTSESDKQKDKASFQHDMERTICDTASLMLESRVTPMSRLLSSGIDSLGAIKFASMLRDHDIWLSPMDILGMETLHDVFLLARRKQSSKNSSKSLIQTNGDHINDGLMNRVRDHFSKSNDNAKLDQISQVYPCTPLQQSMVAQTLDDARMYINQVDLELPHHVSPEMARSWIFLLAEANEILRTGLVNLEEGPCQVVWQTLQESQVVVSTSPLEQELSSGIGGKSADFLQHPILAQIQCDDGPTRIRLTLHHAIYDGWTVDLIREDLACLALGGALVERPQFHAFSSKIGDLLSDVDQTDMARQFWAEHLRGFAPIPVPNFKTTAVVRSQVLQTSHELPTCPDSLRSFARQSGISPQVIFQACLGSLWSAITGAEDVVLGSVTSGRHLPLPDVDKIMGPCIATTPLRISTRKSQTMGELLRLVHVANRESLQHANLPLAEIKKTASLPLSAELFNVLFVYQESLASRNVDATANVREIGHHDVLESKLLVEIQPLQNRFACHMTWHSDAYSNDQTEMFSKHLGNLVQRVIEGWNGDAASVCSVLPLTNLSRYNTNPRTMDIFQGLPELVENTTVKYPQHAALCFASSLDDSSALEAQYLTYENLNKKANQIARHLQRHGARKGGIISIVMEKSPLLYCSILGILKTGSAYLPLLPSTQAMRIKSIFQQAKPQLCLVDSTSPVLPSEVFSGPLVDAESDDIGKESTENVGVCTEPGDLAYIIYTSGTTGTPKGVSVTNRNMLSNIAVLSKIYPNGPSDRMLQACSQAFDVSVFEIFFAWGNAMCLCAAVNDVLFHDLNKSIRSFGATHLSMTVTVASLIDPTTLPSVTFLVTSGEAMTDEVLEKCADFLYQGYGPSETTNICTVRKVRRGDSSQYLGWSFENTSAFVMDPQKPELVPFGCLGEFCFGGDQVAAGYLNMPQTTADKFFDHPEYGRLYRSGDMGRMLPDGSLIILGRIDTQIKLRGLRIELQEIQSITLASGLASACVVLLVSLGAHHTQQLALFYVPTHKLDQNGDLDRFYLQELDEQQTRVNMQLGQELQSFLPDYMVPSFMFPISRLPQTSSGKIDSGRLRLMATDMSEARLSEYSASVPVEDDASDWTESEKSVGQAVSQVLGISSITETGRWTSFAALGMDSISAMPVARKLSHAFSKHIQPSLVLRNPCIARLASAIVSRDETKCSPIGQVQEPPKALLPTELVHSVRSSFLREGNAIQTVLPCTPLQEGMLASSVSQQTDNLSYYNQMVFRLQRPSQEILKYWSVAFERHQILRTCFATTQDMSFPVVQVVLSQTSLPWINLEDEGSTVEQLASRHMTSLPEAINSEKPPVSIATIRTEGAEEFISFICHHAMYDGISMRNLLSEIETMSNGAELSDPVPFEAFLQESLQIPPGADDFWSVAFEGFVPVQFPSPGTEDATLPSTLLKDIGPDLNHVEAGLRSMGTTLLSLSQAAWAISLSMLQGSPDVCFGNIVNGRTVSLDNVDNLIAPCFNTVPLRVNLTAQSLCLETIKKFQGMNIELLPYQFTPLRRIQSKVSPGHRLFETLLLLQPPSEPMNSSIWSLVNETGAMDVPLVCEITPMKKENKLCLQLHRDSAKIPHHTMRLALDIFEMVFVQCLNNPNSQVPTSSKLPARWQQEVHTVASRIVRNVPHLNGGTSEHHDEVSWSQSELFVRAIISQLANIPDTRVEKNGLIFRYGLDSIGAVQIASSLRQEGYQISAADVMENPTCVGIAARIVPNVPSKRDAGVDFEGLSTVAAKDISRIKLPGSVETILPCSPVQQGMLSQFIESGGKLYFNSVSWSLDAHIDTVGMANAWKQLTTRHQILRTGFTPVNHPQASFALIVYTDGSLPENVFHEQSDSFDFKKWQQQTAEASFKNLAAPLWSVVILHTASGLKQMHLCMHHALYDAHSLRMLMRELRAIYYGSQQDQQVTEADTCRIEYALSHIHHQNLTSEHNGFWKERAGQVVVNSFPTMTPLREEGRGVLSVSRACSQQRSSLRKSAAQSDITIQAALQAAWAKILSAYQGEPMVTFGVVLAGRSNEELASAVFPLITTLPVIAKDSEPTQLVQDMMDYNRHLHRHEHVSLSDVQKHLGRSEGSLFDTILVYQTADDDVGTMPWKTIEEKAAVGYTLSMEAEEVVSDELKFNLVFNADVLPSEQAEMMLRQFDSVFVDMVVSHGQPGLQDPSIMSILTPVEPEIPAPEMLLHQLVERTTRQQPDSVALQFVESLDDTSMQQEWSYRELDAIGNQVAALLLSKDIPARSIVAICFDKCPEAYFSILGILKAGHGFLALDPTAPASRQEFILSDSNASMLLTTESMQSSLGFSSPVPVQLISKETLQPFSTVPQNPPSPILPEDTCYCLYTSGTTGTPKGCLITHDNTVQAMLAFKHLFEGHWDARSRWLQFASLHFDVSVLEQYWSWFVGITLVSAPRDLVLSDIVGTISKLDITHIDLTPSLARLVHPNEVPSLCRGVFITGGEQLRQDVLEVWGPQEVIYNAYGPTEATIGVTMYQKVPRNGRPSNIGRQFPNVGSYVFEPGTETPVLRGAVGELCVSGRLVGKGYLNRQELTETRFPTLSQFGERVYRTGDLVRVLCDGTFDFLGRVDDQVKLRGQRLEIGEINYAIKTGLSQKADVATLVTRYGDQDRDMLVSFVAPDIQTDKTGQLRIYSDSASLEMGLKAQDACRSRLPGYMVPTYVVCVPYIPLSANNKANINELKQLFNTLTQEELRNLSSSNGPASRRALNKAEHSVVKALVQTVQVDENSITPASTIFDLGVDSIIVTRLVRNLRETGFLSATVSTVLKNPRIGRLAQVLEDSQPSAPSVDTMRVQQSLRAYLPKYLGMVCRALRVDKKTVEYIAPCTPLQEGMLTRSRTLGDEHSTYFNTFKFNLSPGTSAGKLREALQQIVTENAVLRTAFVPTSDGFVQVALKNRDLPWSDVEIQEGLPQDQVLSSRYDSWVQRNHSILQGPLEFDLVYQDHQPSALVIRIFHAIYDARSFDLILGQLVAHYQGQSVPAGAKFVDILPHGPLSLHGSSRPFWESLFKGRQAQNMPQFTSQPSLSDTMAHKEFSAEGFEEKRKSLEVTHQTMIQAVWFALLSRYFEYPPTIGVIYSGRSIPFPGIENTIGPLFNTLPFTIAAEEHAWSWSSLVAKVHEYNSSVLDFVHVPLRDIQKWCSGGRPLFDVLFSFEKQENPRVEGDPAGLLAEASSKAAADYPLALEAVLNGNGSLELTVVARGGVADESSVLVLLDEFQELLSSLLESDDATMVPSAGKEPQPTSQKTNGIVHEHPSGPTTENQFHWTEHALKLRHEMALLAGVPDQDVSETTSILELGLDSIDAVKLAARLSRMGPRIATSELMKGLSIHGILQKTGTPTDSPEHVLLEQLESASKTLKAKLEQLGRDVGHYEAVLPPTPLQDSMMVEMMLSEGHRYFNHEILKIPSEVDMEKLKDSWREVYFHSPILRTTFEEVEDTRISAAFFQVVHKPANAPDLVRPTLTVPTQDDIWGHFDQVRAEAWEAKGSGNLLQVTPVIAGDDNYLVVSIAHALYDGWSLDMLYHDVQASYEGNFSSRLSYEPYLGKILYGSGSGQSSLDFWSDFMHDVKPTLLLAPEKEDSTTPSYTIHRGTAQSRLSPGQIKKVCKRFAITPQVLGQACLAGLLATLTNSLEVTFGVVLSGRDSSDAQELMFPTMNTVAMRAILHGTVDEFLRYMQDTMSSVMEFQQLPLRQAQQLAGTEGRALFNALFTLQTKKDDQISTPGGSIMRSVNGTSAIEYPFCVEMELTSTCVKWHVALDERYGFDASHVNSTLRDLEAVLSLIADESTTDLLSFDALGQKASLGNGMNAIDLPREVSDIELQGAERTMSSSPEETGWTAAEEESPLLAILSQVAGIDKASIRPQDSIHNIGLDSISMMKVSSLARKRGLNVSTRDLLRATAIRDVIERVKSHTAVAEPQEEQIPLDTFRRLLGESQCADLAARINLSLDQIEFILPALPVQVHMLSTWQNTHGRLFFPTFGYTLRGDISLQTVQKAWPLLVAEVPVLRSHFVSTKSDQTPIALVIRKSTPDDYMQTNGMADPKTDSWTYTNKPTPFVSLHIERLSLQPATLRLRIHHALYDAISLPMLVQRFEALCNEARAAEAPTPTVQDVSSEQWLNFVNRNFSPRVQSEKQQFWAQYFEGLNTKPSSTITNGQQPLSNGVGKTHKKYQATKLLRRGAFTDVTTLKTLCAHHGISIQALFFAAYANVLLATEQEQKQTNQSDGKAQKDVVFGIYLANRAVLSEQQPSNLPCPTLNILPLRVRLSNEETSNTLLKTAVRIQKDLDDIRTNSSATHAGLWEVDQWTGGDVDATSSPLHVDHFVNFLSSSSSSTPTSTQQPKRHNEEGKDDTAVQAILDMPDDDDVDLSATAEEEQEEGLAHPNDEWIRGNLAKEYYPGSAVDIEVAIREDEDNNSTVMDIGAFGSSSHGFTMDRAEDTVTRIVEILGRLE